MTKINFEIEEAKVVNDNPDSQFATAKLRLFSSGQNRHNLICSEETLKKTAPSAYEKPIIFEVRYGGDFGTHNPDTNVPAGFIVKDSAEFERMDDGRLSLFVLGKIWKMYSGKFIDIFKNKRTTDAKLSVEMELLDSRRIDDTVQEMLDFAYSAACILGDMVTEASPGANIQMLSFAYQEAVKKEFGKYENIDFNIPQNVKLNASKALESYNKTGVGATTVCLAIARHLIKNDVVSPEKLKAIHKYLSTHKDNKKDDKLSYMLHGGDEAYEWAKDIVEKMDLEDNEQLSYFEHIGFPYTKAGDMNPSLKGIDPPITVEQGNEIARQADGIGADKGGWGIAISHFKKTHKVKDDRWVKMEEDGMKEFAKEDLGKGESLKVDKSKEKLSDSPWSNVDKTSLQHKILSASNYKSLVKDVYLLVEDGWEDAPSQHLKYPVMQISAGTLVYNRGALGNALARATQQNEGGVISKIHGIYKKLDLGETAKKEEMSVEDEKEVKEEEMAVETPEEEKKEDPEEEKKETPEEEKKEQEDEKKEEMSSSLDDNVDMSAILEMLKDDTEEYQKLASDYQAGNVDFAKVCNSLYCKMCNMKASMEKMSNDKEVYMQELMGLKEFKAQFDADQFAAEVEKTLCEVSDMPKDKVDEAREDSKNFSMETIDAWKNKTKAIAFSYVKKGEKKEDNIVRMGLPFANIDRSKVVGSPWKR